MCGKSSSGFVTFSPPAAAKEGLLLVSSVSHLPLREPPSPSRPKCSFVSPSPFFDEPACHFSKCRVLFFFQEPFLIIEDVVGTYELSSCYNVTIDCRAADMVATVRTNKVISRKKKSTSCAKAKFKKKYFFISRQSVVRNFDFFRSVKRIVNVELEKQTLPILVQIDK